MVPETVDPLDLLDHLDSLDLQESLAERSENDHYLRQVYIWSVLHCIINPFSCSSNHYAADLHSVGHLVRFRWKLLMLYAVLSPDRATLDLTDLRAEMVLQESR